ncbi:MAG: hypothetical protein ACYDEY_07315 [Acidimicrobiales bacterium]
MPSDAIAVLVRIAQAGGCLSATGQLGNRATEGPFVFETHDRGHGRIEHRSFKVADCPKELAKEPRFLYAAQFIAVTRKRATPHRTLWVRVETSYYVTDVTAQQAGPRELAEHIRDHWGIENHNYYVRDETFGEELSRSLGSCAPKRSRGRHAAAGFE